MIHFQCLSRLGCKCNGCEFCMTSQCFTSNLKQKSNQNMGISIFQSGFTGLQRCHIFISRSRYITLLDWSHLRLFWSLGLAVRVFIVMPFRYRTFCSCVFDFVTISNFQVCLYSSQKQQNFCTAFVEGALCVKDQFHNQVLRVLQVFEYLD